MPIILYYHCNGGLDLRPICNVGLEPRPNIIRFPISLFHISFECHCHHLLRAGGLFHIGQEHRAELDLAARGERDLTARGERYFAVL